MSHIPSAAMPHAKPHADLPEPIATPPATGPKLPWAALLAGGALAIGGIAAAAWLTRGKASKGGRRPAVRRRKTTAKRTRKAS